MTFKQALDAGGNVRKGEHGTKVYFVKQVRVTEGEGKKQDTRLIPMLREYTVFNVDQCDGLPDSIRSTSSPCALVDHRRGNGTANDLAKHAGVPIRSSACFLKILPNSAT